jgi:hypothetical protein
MRIAGAVLLAVLAAALLELLKDEVRGQIERIPYGLLRLARARVPAELRESLYDREWLPELRHILEGADRLPLTCLLRGIRYALGILGAARVIADELGCVRGAAAFPEPRWTDLRLELAAGGLAAAASLTSSFGVFGPYAGTAVCLAGGLVEIAVFYLIMERLGVERETPLV